MFVLFFMVALAIFILYLVFQFLRERFNQITSFAFTSLLLMAVFTAHVNLPNNPTITREYRVADT